PAHHAEEVGFDARTIDKRRADDDDFHASLLRQAPQLFFGFMLGDTVRIGWLRRILYDERPVVLRAFAVDLDRADENEATDSSCRSLAGESERPFHIDAPKLSQRIYRRIIHHMHARSGVNYDIAPGQGEPPVGVCPHSADGSYR